LHLRETRPHRRRLRHRRRGGVLDSGSPHLDFSLMGRLGMASKRQGAAGAMIWLLAVMCAGSALAHAGADHGTGGFGSGFTHPLLGPDHVIAMVAVGLWG